MRDPSPAGGLKWVQGEIVASLRRVRAWLEAFVEQGAAEAGLADAVTALSEVRGVLTALQLTGPARLTEEMQHLCEDIVAGRIADLGDASEALMLALIQLPDYLERLQRGHTDVPIALLGSINDLRGTRRAPPLSEAEMLVPASVLADSGMPLPEAQQAMSRVAAKVRPHFHRSLLLWFREETARQGLVSLGRLFHQLQRYVRDGVFHELFLAGEAVVEGMLEGSLPADRRNKALIGHFDRVIKPFVEHPEAWPETDAQALLVDLLSLIARCDSSSYLMTELRSAYGLDRDDAAERSRMEPPDWTDAGARSAGPAPEALRMLAAEARRELVPVKDLLDLYGRGVQEDRGRLTQLARQLGQLANTLSITGDEVLVERLHRCERLCAALAEGDGPVDERRLLPAAEELLAVEDALAELAAGGAAARRSEAVREVAAAALREARLDMARAEQAISDLTGEAGGLRAIAEVPELFHRVAGALRVMNETDAADVLDTVVEQIRHRYMASGRVPEGRELDLLAGAISGIDLYVEGLCEGHLYRSDLVEQAQAAADELAALPGIPSLRPSVAGVESVEFAPPAGVPLPEAPPKAEAPAEGAAAIDPEFLEIFLEEAREEEQTIRDQFARWRRDESDETALTTLRRSFHTLKGSGRLVGAMRMGEFARAVEMLLNRVIDGTVTASPQIVGFVGHAVSLLPALIEAEASATPFDIGGPVARAEELALPHAAHGLYEDASAPPVPANVIPWPAQPATAASLQPAEAFPEPAPDPSAPEEPEVDAATAAEVAALAAVDEELLDIFRTEAGKHLAVLRAFLAETAAASESTIPSEAAVRALHTLTGSARMTGVGSSAAATGALERLFAAYRMVGADADGPALDLLSRVIDAVTLRLEHLPGAGREAATLHALAGQAAHQLAGFSATAIDEPQPAGAGDAGAVTPAVSVSGPQTTEVDEVFGEAALPITLELDWEAPSAVPERPVAPPVDDDASLIPEVGEPGDEPPPAVIEIDWEEFASAGGAALALAEAPAADEPPTPGEARESPADIGLALEWETREPWPEGQDEAREEESAGIGLAVDWETPDARAEDLVADAALFAHGAGEADEDAGWSPLPDGAQPGPEPVEPEEIDREGAFFPGEVPETRETALEPQAAAEPDIEARSEPLPPPQPEPTPAVDVDETPEPEPGPGFPAEPADLLPAPIWTPPPVWTPTDLPAAASTGAAETDTPALRTEPEPAAADELAELPEDGELLVLFLEDARDILDKLDQRLRDLQLAPTAPGPIEEIQRLLHTLKGSARLSGLAPIGDLSHALESLLAAIARGDAQVDDDTLELAQRSLDALSSQVDAVEGRLPLRRFTALVAALSQALEHGLAAAPGPEPDLAVMAPVPTEAPEPLSSAPAARAAEAAVAHIRVRADLLNRLVNNAGEISIYRSRLAQQANLQGFRLGELGQTVERLREQLRQLEIETEAQILYRYERDTDQETQDQADFDPLELDRFSTLQQLSRSLAETVNDLVSLRVLLSDIQSESETLLQQQARIADDLQDGLLRTRMTPFAQVVPRLHRLVRQTAEQLGRKAQLQVFGPEVELDRGIQERIVAPLEHLLRNAVAHGIEPPERRAAAGKPPSGTISLRLSREGNDVVIAVSDDGAGLNLPAIRRRAMERGLLTPDAQPSDEELAQLILESGFSTAEHVTQISGRGVGLDVVNAEIKQLSGSFNLEFRQGQGTSFTIRLPLTLAIIEALLVDVAGEVVAIPHATVEAVSRVSRADLEACHRGEERTLAYAGHDYRVVYLGGLLRLPQAPDFGERRWLPVLLARSGDQRLALHVDLLRGSQRIVVKPLGLSLGSIRWLSGGTILPDGRVALIVDLLALIRSGAIHEYVAPKPQEAPGEHRACVMVVDDSLTVRRVTSRMLRRQDMDVITAQDGIEALTLLEERVPDIILLDIEMPRMDGYELTRHIRRSPRLKDIPLIMITSRTGEKHRRHALELGVDRYLGKPYQEAELLDEISSVLMEASR